jgi:hypothetical protein
MNDRLTNIEDIAQSEMGSRGVKEISLIHKIDNSTRELIEGLRTIESLTENINKRFLPLIEKPLLSESKVEQAPTGWLEIHLADLCSDISKIVRIITNLEKLSRETKTDVK